MIFSKLAPDNFITPSCRKTRIFAREKSVLHAIITRPFALEKGVSQAINTLLLAREKGVSHAINTRLFARKEANLGFLRAKRAFHLQ